MLFAFELAYIRSQKYLWPAKGQGPFYETYCLHPTPPSGFVFVGTEQIRELMKLETLAMDRFD